MHYQLLHCIFRGVKWNRAERTNWHFKCVGYDFTRRYRLWNPPIRERWDSLGVKNRGYSENPCGLSCRTDPTIVAESVRNRVIPLSPTMTIHPQSNEMGSWSTHENGRFLMWTNILFDYWDITIGSHSESADIYCTPRGIDNVGSRDMREKKGEEKTGTTEGWGVVLPVVSSATVHEYPVRLSLTGCVGEISHL